VEKERARGGGGWRRRRKYVDEFKELVDVEAFRGQNLLRHMGAIAVHLHCRTQNNNKARHQQQ
jgi:hypothetical protein